MQNRRRKWHFPLNFRNGIIWTSPFPPNIRNIINWAGATSKAFSSSEALISVLSKNARLYDNTVHWTNIQMVTSGYQFMNLKFVHLSKNMPTEHQHLVTVLAYRKYCRRRFKYSPCTSQGNNISVLCNFCNHPEKVGKMSQKQSASACTHRIHSEMGKENKLAFRNYIIYLYLFIFTTKKPQKDEMRWKWNLALNNEMRMNEMKTKPCT